MSPRAFAAPCLLPTCGLCITPLAAVKALLYLDPVVEEMSFEELRLNYDTLTDCLILYSLGSQAYNNSSPLLSFGYVLLVLL